MIFRIYDDHSGDDRLAQASGASSRCDMSAWRDWRDSWSGKWPDEHDVVTKMVRYTDREHHLSGIAMTS